MRSARMCLFAAAINLTAIAQEVATPPAQDESTTPSTTTPTISQPPPPSPTNGTQIISSLAPPPGAALEGSPLQWGLVGVRPHLFYRYLHGNGLQSNPGQPLTTAINSFAPGILFNLGDRWTLDYTATKTFYSNREFNDSLGHAVLLAGTTTYEDWALRLSQSYGLSSDPLVETGRQTNQRAYATACGVTRSLGGQMQLEMTVSQDVRMVDASPDSRDWSTTDWLHFQLAPGLDTAVGLGLGYVDVSPGPNMTHESAQARVTWRATSRISLDVQGGLEKRKFNSSAANDLNNPILSASIQYQPVETTAVSIQAVRDVAASYFVDQVTENTRWSVNLQQRLLGEFHLLAGYAHQRAGYVSTRANLPAGRDDKYDSYNLRLSTVFFRRVTAAALYQINRNSSNVAGYGFSSHQIGIEVGYRF